MTIVTSFPWVRRRIARFKRNLRGQAWLHQFTWGDSDSIWVWLAERFAGYPAHGPHPWLGDLDKLWPPANDCRLPGVADLQRLRPLSQRGESAATPCRTDLVLGGEGRPCLESELSAWADRTPPGSPQGEPLASGPVSQPITGHLTNTPAAPLPSMGIMGRLSSPIGQAAAAGRPQDRAQEEGKSPAALPGDRWNA